MGLLQYLGAKMKHSSLNFLITQMRKKSDGEEREREGGEQRRHTISTFIHLIYTENISERKLLSSQLAHEKMFWVLSHQGKWKSKPTRCTSQPPGWPHPTDRWSQDWGICTLLTGVQDSAATPLGAPWRSPMSWLFRFCICAQGDENVFSLPITMSLWEIHTEICMQGFIVTLFMIAKNGNHDCVHHLMNGFINVVNGERKVEGSARPSNNRAKPSSII